MNSLPDTTPAEVLPARRLEALSLVVLQLHRGSRDWPAAFFAARAFELLGTLLPFQAGVWGSVRAEAPPGTPLDVLGLHAEGLTPAELSACLFGQGPAPGLHVVAQEPLAARRVELSLWRHGPETGFSSAEQSTAQFLMPHLVEAQRENRLSRAHDDPVHHPGRRSHALCDAEGVLQQVDEHGLALLRTEWPRWCDARLPEPLARAVAAVAAAPRGAAAEPHHGRQVTVLLTRSGDLVLMEVRRRTAVDRLSTRQRDIATLYVDGHTGPQIAEQLGLSPSTVNNHLGVIFKKLAVSNKVQLLNVMRPR